MPVRLIVTFPVLPRKGKELAEAFAPRMKEVREEPGCEQYELFVSSERPDGMVLLERWSDEVTLQAHMELNQKRPSVIQHLMDGRPTLERYQI